VSHHDRSLARLTKRQVETLTQVASGHVIAMTYQGMGLSFMGPGVVFSGDDLGVLSGMGLIRISDTVILTAAGIEVLISAPDSAFFDDEDALVWVRRLRITEDDPDV
jgi:hypothetical protein